MSTTRITDNDYADVALYDKVNTIANEIDNELDGKANASNTVTTDTNQTISSQKSFNGRVNLNGDVVKNVTLNVNENPSKNQYILPFVTENGDQSIRAYQQLAYYTDGSAIHTFGLRRTVNGSNVFSSIDARIDKNGNSYTSATSLTTSKLTFTDHLYKNTGIDSKVNPSTYKEVILLDAKDTNGILNSSIRTCYRADGTIDTLFYTGKDGLNKAFVVRMMSNGQSVLLGQTPNLSATGVEIPTANWVKSILSTSGNGLATLISNANGNAIKFSNGLIMQWGESQANNSKMTITLPTPFTSGDSYQVFTQFIDGNQSANCSYIQDQTATSFKWDRYGGIAQFKVSWLAIGY